VCAQEGYSGLLGLIEALDTRTVRFTLCAPDGAFLARIAHPAMAILDSATIDALAADPARERAIAGTGPYRIADWQTGVEIRLAPDDQYAGSPPVPGLIVFRWDDSGATRLVQLHSEAVDGIDDPDQGDVDVVANDPSLHLVPRVGLGTAYLGFTPAKPFDHAVVRQAIGMILDRSALLELFPAGSTLATHVAPCVIGGACGADDWPDPDPTRAKEILKAEGFDLTKTYPIHVPSGPIPGLAAPSDLAEAIGAQLKERAGISTEVDTVDAASYEDQLAAGGLRGMHLGAITTSIADPSAFLGMPAGVGSGKTFGTADKALAKAVRTATRSGDPGTREASFTTANERMLAAAPLVPLVHPGSTAAFRADVEAASGSPLGVEALARMRPGNRPQLVWMQATEPQTAYCADAQTTDAERLCALVTEPLYAFGPSDATPEPRLAERCAADDTATVWTCTLRSGVRFHDGTRLDASDVVASFAAQWDVNHPLHVARGSARFGAWTELFGAFLDDAAS
jgi:ABC-type transport system substrate-binding protein